MNDQYDNQEFCNRHPNQALVGICPLCLNDKLLAIAANQRRRSLRQDSFPRASHSRKPSNVGLPKIFPFGSLLNRLDIFHHHNRRGTYDFDGDCGFDTQSTCTSIEDSFISVKIEENGVALWEKSRASKSSSEEQIITNNCDTATINKSVVEHMNTHRGSMRWRKRIGHLFQLVRWKKTNKSNAGGIVKAKKKNWIRTLTRRRTYKD